MRTAIAVAIAVVAFAAALLLEAPASLLDARLASISDGRVRIAHAAGTLWRGSGDLVLAAGGPQRPVAWRIEAWPLLRGELRGSFTGADSQRIATFDAGEQARTSRHRAGSADGNTAANARRAIAPGERRRRGHAAGRPSRARC
jgi:hypothetical protein